MGDCNKKVKTVHSSITLPEVHAGPCDPVYGSPPPTEIVCVVVKKVYDECKNVQVNEDEFIYYTSTGNPIVDVECGNVEIVSVPECEIVRPGRVRVNFSYKVSVRIFFQDESITTLSQIVPVMKTFSMPRAGEEGLFVQCSVPFIECLQCFIRDEELVVNGARSGNNIFQVNGEPVRTTIVCCVGKYLLLKLKAWVQLMIPAFGFCPEPPDCPEVLGECPDFRPQWPPFPEQI